MSTLSRQARDTIRFWYAGNDPRIKVTVAGYIRHYSGDGPWTGDSCGCVDDRCIGYHHDEHQECHCLEAWLDQWVREQEAALAAAPVWEAYRAGAYADALSAATAWVKEFQGAGVVGVRVGLEGISIRTRWNDLDHLVWPAPADVQEVGR